MRQCARWSSEPDVLVIARSLRYPRNWPAERAQEKGIDVHLAVGLVRGYALNKFDIAVVASTDTDLVPAIEAVFDLDRRLGYEPIEISTWFEDSFSKQLRVAGRTVYCHEFPLRIYNRVADPNDYNVR